MHKKDSKLSYEQVKMIFDSAGFLFTKETIQCCFIFLMKKTKDLLQIEKSDLVQFIHSSAGKAHDFTMTGAKFPIETDLVYSSSDDEEVGLPDTEVVDPTGGSSAAPAKKDEQAIVKKASEISVERLDATRNGEASAIDK